MMRQVEFVVYTPSRSMEIPGGRDFIQKTRPANCSFVIVSETKTLKTARREGGPRVVFVDMILSMK